VTEEILNSLHAAAEISALDLHFARLMMRLGASGEPELALAAALVSRATGRGHICMDLRAASRELLDKRWVMQVLPEFAEWSRRLARSPVVGAPGEYRPLVLDDAGRLYLYRYWEYQRKLADALRARIGQAPVAWDPDDLGERLHRLFPSEGGEVDWQKVAALASLRKTFCVVSGGPGTGKTTTVAKVLALLLELAPSGSPRIALAAPTGKAAARLQEAIKNAKGKLNCPEEVKAAIPEAASTIHRLLGSISGSPAFRHNADNPLAVDVLVVDEASMVDLPLMSRLVQALPPEARLILLGDRDQLSSVEAGAVLGDICRTGGRILFSRGFALACQEACGAPMDEGFIADGAQGESRDCIIELRKSYRFSGESGIALFSSKVKSNDADGALATLRGSRHADLAWTEISSCINVGRTIREDVVGGFREYLEAVRNLRESGGGSLNDGLRRVFGCFDGFRVLCPLREGPCGVGALNRLVEEILEEDGLMERRRRWYAGRPVLILRNDYTLRLFNGDIGLVLPDIENRSDQRVFFPGPEGMFRSFHPQRLPEHETVWAMTVHKSQGSEFDEILLVLPDRDSPVMTRELLYTAVTRARKKVTVLGSEPVLRQAVARSTQRLSGLSDALWGAGPSRRLIPGENPLP
jgi:exodeoxyribonuclease V alpha subunit